MKDQINTLEKIDKDVKGKIEPELDDSKKNKKIKFEKPRVVRIRRIVAAGGHKG